MAQKRATKGAPTEDSWWQQIERRKLAGVKCGDMWRYVEKAHGGYGVKTETKH